ncbi:indolepyruvate ferredoxin oxidoreductase, subunit iorB [Archaeoglobus sulfaticallidus PM70-1]|uniref:Indolepyruvate ferredoxin oxidoreductase subunit beta n=1 Tax=Archaeoglobus sulfaticallidus PM70-1 TaxID=387631 RepID=N0BPG0_9EURY|nr:indolepyruvate ferredoxin oxidoreductase subunit beta [Archaeoglobus sulfaticallidus]AGK62250.1 indolepyruvate ferredoxin oxidoreductase, subunit iorB [Archaeoglobus sulfaticallidus PM70-1]
MNARLNILIVGVGGQGVLTSSNIIARAAMRKGMNVLTSETHGMAQRGGSVEVHVRIGDVHSPLIPFGSADIVIALEPVEALRYAHYMNENTMIILNSRKIKPTTVNVGLAEYPEIEEIIERLKTVTEKIKVVDASAIAEKVARVQATNVVVLGMLAKVLEGRFLTLEDLEYGVRAFLPERLVEINLKALKAGYESLS